MHDLQLRAREDALQLETKTMMSSSEFRGRDKSSILCPKCNRWIPTRTFEAHRVREDPDLFAASTQ
jgi:hypothetical protein